MVRRKIKGVFAKIKFYLANLQKLSSINNAEITEMIKENMCVERVRRI